MKKRPLSWYVVSVITALVVLNLVVWYLGGQTRLEEVARYSLGFLLGMLAMYIAVHLYAWK